MAGILWHNKAGGFVSKRCQWKYNLTNPQASMVKKKHVISNVGIIG
jgi:hypothetical protein